MPQHKTNAVCLKTIEETEGSSEERTVAVWSKAWVCGCSLAGNAGSNPVGGMDVCLLWIFCVLSGRGLYVGPITRPEEFYCVRVCVCVCVCVYANNIIYVATS